MFISRIGVFKGLQKDKLSLTHRVLISLIVIISTQSCVTQIENNKEFTKNFKNNSYNSISSIHDNFIAEFDKQKVDDSLESIFTQAMSTMKPNSSHLLIEKELEAVFYRDQIFRDSINQKELKNSDKKKYYSKKFRQSDKLNQRIILGMFEELGWVDTREMSQNALDGILYTIFHCNDDKEFNKVALKNLNKAFREDSIITNKFYAITADRISMRLEGKTIYGTHTYFWTKREFKRSTINEFNKQRKLIGLSNYLEEESYY